MKNGKAWGCIDQDGHSSEYGWLDPEDATIHNPQFCLKPTDVTYAESPYIAELFKGKIVAVERTTTVRIIL